MPSVYLCCFVVLMRLHPTAAQSVLSAQGREDLSERKQRGRPAPLVVSGWAVHTGIECKSCRGGAPCSTLIMPLLFTFVLLQSLKFWVFSPVRRIEISKSEKDKKVHSFTSLSLQRLCASTPPAPLSSIEGPKGGRGVSASD